MVVERDIAGHVVVELRRARLGGFCGVGHGGQRLDVEHDGFGGVARLRQGLGDHEGDGIADKAHLVGRQRGCGWLCISGEPSRFFSGRPQVKDAVAGRHDSAPVQTPSTPGIVLRASVSMPRMMPWAWLVRTIQA